MPFLSAVIITRDEERHIARAVRSLASADEILVVDSGSKDRTCEIASRMGARVIEHPWKGYAEQKNFAASAARHDWIVSLDADEELDPRMQKALGEWKQTEPAAVGYRFRRRAFYLGRWIRHSGWYPDWKLRLYDRRRARWLDLRVHESVLADGPVETLQGELLHYTCDTFREHVERVEGYTSLAAQEMFEKGMTAGVFRRMGLPVWAFAEAYVLKRGFLDGYQGLLIAAMASVYVYKKYGKLGRLYRKENL